MDLHWLSVPNKPLNVGYGGLLMNYPYLYVHIYNEGKRETNQLLLSNNPNSILAIFKIPIDENCGSDVNFLTLKSCRIKQTLRFEPDQDLRFTVTLPNGIPLSFSTADNFSPLAPNPYMQINALISLKKL